MSISYQVTLLDCQLSEKTVWENIKNVDKLNQLDLMCMVMESYYKLHNNNKTPKDLELELRKHNLNVGLIAVEWEKENYYKQRVKDNKGIIIKKKNRHEYFGKSLTSAIQVKPDHLTKYIVFISCRPRNLVIEETLTHSKSMEENLEKLELGGDFITFTEDILDEKEDIKINKSDINSKLQAGTKLVKLELRDYEKIFNQYKNDNPDAKILTYATLQNGAPFNILVEENKIVCPVGFHPYTDSEGNTKYKYMPIPQQNTTTSS